jgi:NAD(P)-dependent dehydrogenase (short-subunit alcohol dehydrogenase family)
MADQPSDPNNPPRPTSSLYSLVAIVTGAGSSGNGIGNGRASAILLAQAGCNVVCSDISLSAAQVTVDMIEKETTETYGMAVAVATDVTDEKACKALVDQTVAEFGRLDILVNNVGIGGARGTAAEVDMKAWEDSMRVNVSSMVMMSKYAIPHMLNNPERFGVKGSIVNIASVAGLRGGTPSLLYPTSKGAIVNMTRAMASHHGPEGIRVNCVCPGMLYTPMMYGTGMTEEMREARRKRSLLQTEGNGWDCGCAVRFLASDEAR